MNEKVLIIPDFPNWALDKNARDLVKYNKSGLQLDICYYNEFEQNWRKYYDQYDILFPMYLGSFKSLVDKKIPTDKVITGIRSFHRWDKKKTQPPGYNAKPPRKIINLYRKALLVNTHCKKLWYIFSEYFRVVHTKYTCDQEMFYPLEKKKNDKLVIGWTGSLTNHPNKRGFHEFIKLICDELDGVELKVQAKEDNFITDDNLMRDYYNSLDLYICASRSEGTPRPVIEAAACGVPVISTDVGIVPELIDDGFDGFIVDRNYNAIKSKIKWISENRDLLPEIGIRIRGKMEKEFNWNYLITQWTDYFRYAIELYKLRKQGFVK
ncbi:MAG: glycosyltransferase family 4 protein [Melioribacteraceae bacterium]|nr:glycosyltransferase family 4 protein [Melioribacteraceae bacterium]